MHDTKYLVHGTRYQVLEHLHLAPTTWCMVQGILHLVFDFSFAHLVFDLYDAVIVAGVHQ